MNEVEQPRAAASGEAYLRKAARGGMSLGIGQGLGATSTWLATLVLARLLVPADFGLVGMATVILGFVNAFADLGLTAALIQRKELEDAHKDSAFWSSVAVGVLLFSLCCAAAPLIAWLYREPRVNSVVVISAISLLLGPLWTTHAALLRRRLEFAAIARIDVLRNLTAGTTSVVGALAGLGHYAILLGPIASHLIAIPAYRLGDKSWRPGLRGTRAHARQLYSFSLYVAGTSVVNYVSANVDYLVVGRVLGPSALGVYMLAYQWITFPLTRIASLFNQVMFPAFSALQDRLDAMGEGYLKISRSVALISFPILGAMAVAAPELLHVLYGDKWLAAVPVLRILALAGALKSVGTLVGIVYRARGKARVELYWNLAWTVAISIGVLTGVRWGTTGVAAAVSALSLPGVLYTQWLACRYLELPFPRWLGRVSLPAAGAAAAVCAGFGARALLDQANLGGTLGSAARLVTLLLLTLCAYALTVRALQPAIAAEVKAFAGMFRKAG